MKVQREYERSLLCNSDINDTLNLFARRTSVAEDYTGHLKLGIDPLQVFPVQGDSTVTALGIEANTYGGGIVQNDTTHTNNTYACESVISPILDKCNLGTMYTTDMVSLKGRMKH